MSASVVRKRRFFLEVCLAVTLLAFSMASSSRELPRIGVITPAAASAIFESALRDSLRDLGYIDSRSIRVDWHRSPGPGAQLTAMANALVKSEVDLILVMGTPEAQTVLKATKRIPVVFGSGDPIKAGLVTSLARPGGNGTGVSLVSPELTAKRLELLRELVPSAKRIAYLGNASNVLNLRHFEEAQTAARALGFTLHTFQAGNVADLDEALAAIERSKPDGVIITADLFLVGEKSRIAVASRKFRWHTIFPYEEFHDDGALMSYGYSLRWVTSRTAIYIDKVLRGADPSELPVEQLTKFRLVIDVREARAMNIKIPQSLLARADEVIK